MPQHEDFDRLRLVVAEEERDQLQYPPERQVDQGEGDGLCATDRHGRETLLGKRRPAQEPGATGYPAPTA